MSREASASASFMLALVRACEKNGAFSLRMATILTCHFSSSVLTDKSISQLVFQTNTANFNSHPPLFQDDFKQ
ncbi:hypothetical protein FB192DRAFT_1449743 [Mucor lusitanicus]|uniref:Uncharacterized protein n=2 Tax=Mucor circinelloides f. lusitanicus TaxID=29924 RepID=A0A168NRZ1_MUCCL|nr:hypothetical protein FB192DRAFT_1449743 [Mucor lusitanicus]OAD06653.1 hypothetical protein MUCCIDRAFT_107231 [Mucor lusitanicus CBS 277.49]